MRDVQASDFTFVYVESTQSLSAAADRYDIVEVGPLGKRGTISCFLNSDFRISDF